MSDPRIDAIQRSIVPRATTAPASQPSAAVDIECPNCWWERGDHVPLRAGHACSARCESRAVSGEFCGANRIVHVTQLDAGLVASWHPCARSGGHARAA